LKPTCGLPGAGYKSRKWSRALKTFIPDFSAVLLAALTCTLPSFAQQKPEYDMGKMQMVFLRGSPEWKAEDRAGGLGKEHQAYVESLAKDGKLALWGEVAGDGDLREIMVVKTESLQEAQQMAESLPPVKTGTLRADTLSWYAARNLIRTPQMPLTRSSYILGFLVRGPKWTKEQTEETKKIQEGHLANINRLAEAGKLVLAGPFYGDRDRRGVFIFKVDSLAEAQALTDTDPAVIAGRLKIELHRWSVLKGMLP
jgi:uncharacterized protein YciI